MKDISTVQMQNWLPNLHKTEEANHAKDWCYKVIFVPTNYPTQLYYCTPYQALVNRFCIWTLNLLIQLEAAINDVCLV